MDNCCNFCMSRAMPLFPYDDGYSKSWICEFCLIERQDHAYMDMEPEQEVGGEG